MKKFESVPWGTARTVYIFDTHEGRFTLYIHRVDYQDATEPSFRTLASLHNIARIRQRKIRRVARHLTSLDWLMPWQLDGKYREKIARQGMWTTDPRIDKLHTIAEWAFRNGDLDLNQVWIDARITLMYLANTFPPPPKPATPKEEPLEAF